jgi:hypothetical protein
MTEDKKSFTVKDRRHFTAEGETRSEAEETAAAETKPDPRPETKPEAKSETRSAPPSSPEPPGARPMSGPEAAHRPALDFAGLLLSLGAQASLLLGMGDEEEPGAAPDFQGAQAIISLLEVLREKTEGRRTPEEDRILEGILYELRMAYVAGTRAGGA